MPLSRTTYPHHLRKYQQDLESIRENVPLDPERTQHLHPIMAMRRPVHIPRIRRERPKLRPALRDGLHRAQRERPEVRVERVQRCA